MRPHLNTAWHFFLGIIASHVAGERDRGLLCAAHVANWLVSCHLVFLQIGKLSFSAGALEPLSLLSRLPQIVVFCDGEMIEYSLVSSIYLPVCCAGRSFRGLMQS